jgi:peptidoglycan hydrolase-like protein with peptidoglycan-binding domain
MRVARYVVPALLVTVIGVVVAFGVIVKTSQPKLSADSQALARITMPTGGGTVERVVATGGRQQQVVPVTFRDGQVWPTGKVDAGEPITITATIKRPSWISWLAGKTKTVKMKMTTPTVALASHFVTRAPGKALTVSYKQPVATFGYGAVGSRVKSHTASGTTELTLNESDVAGTVAVAAAARIWERPVQTTVSWFPGGSKATAVASPAPGTQITSSTKLTLTFSKPVADVLGKSMPVVTPSTTGSWHQVNSHTIEFDPTGYGYGLSTNVSVALPTGVQLVSGGSTKPTASWTVPQGTTMRLQQLLANLGYLPVNFTPSGTPVASTISAQEAAAVTPPQGSFSWRYPDTPTALKQMWTPGNWSELMKGAVMAFESNEGLTVDGIPGPAVWKALIAASMKNQQSTFGYTFVYVSEGSPETINVWHSGKTVVSGLANTGIPQSPTATGTYAVYEHLPSGTMTGTNPNGTPYHDVGIPWISYFNGGDALHGFIRASYGFKQSLGCVEMPFSEAGRVYPYTPIGTIVNIVD